MLPRLSILAYHTTTRTIYVPRMPIPPGVSPQGESPWIYKYTGLPGSPEATPRRIEHASLYRLIDEYGRQTIGVVPESRELRNLLFECRTADSIDRYFEYIAAGAASVAPVCPKMLIGAASVYGYGYLREYVPLVLAKNRLRRLLDDPECAEFVAAF